MAGQTSVIPLISSNIDWTHFIKDVAELTGHSPTRGIDTSSIKLSSCVKYITALAEIREGKEVDSLSVIRNADDLLDHLSFGFLICGSKNLIFKLMERTDLKIVVAKEKRVAVATGTLKQWKGAIINCLGPFSNNELRWVMDSCLMFFDKLGLQNIFYDYRRKGLKDGTFLLEYKK